MHDTAGSGIIGCDMAQHGEWSRKGATLSDVTARKEYGVNSDFIVKGINAGKLEYREGAIHGNPYLRVLRRQLEAYIVEELGDDHRRRRRPFRCAAEDPGNPGVSPPGSVRCPVQEGPGGWIIPANPRAVPGCARHISWPCAQSVPNRADEGEPREAVGRRGPARTALGDETRDWRPRGCASRQRDTCSVVDAVVCCMTLSAVIAEFLGSGSQSARPFSLRRSALRGSSASRPIALSTRCLTCGSSRSTSLSARRSNSTAHGSAVTNRRACA